MLPHSARGDEYAEVIAKIYRDDQRYAQMVRSGRAAFDERLNWDAWGRAVKEIVNETTSRSTFTRPPNGGPQTLIPAPTLTLSVNSPRSTEQPMLMNALAS